ncbi:MULTISPECIES: rhodanese-like domain-containing protein [Rhodomicrobium]|uniref:rhodanese-like domain-containing protein n=1 Tax=Rhodomicrobium TaxID=1068 RepID=UPI000B4BC3C5|nr:MULTISPECIES: rhodanese-like domain-containing protein [Rhodomicrobium]
MTQTIVREEIKRLLDNGEPLTLVEALPEKYYRHAHLPGALNIPHDRTRELAPAMLPDKDAPIVVYCANEPCRNSTIAAGELEAMGYRNVREYAGGKQDWIDAGLPVVKGALAA